MSDERAFQQIPSVPSHTSPPDDGITYAQIDRVWFRVVVGDYTGADLRRYAVPSIPVDHDLWRINPLGQRDVKVADDEVIYLRNSGQRFFSTPRFINA